MNKQQSGGARPDETRGGRGGEGGPPGDPQLLLALARDPSSEGRHSLALSMADLFGAGGGLSQRSRDLAVQILDRLIRSFETELRHALAERLASKPDVPRALILLLANDAIEVARPVLMNSEVLLPDDLIDIIENHGADHQLAIAMRDNLTELVCSALVATDNVVVIETLLKNDSASISQVTLDYLVEEAHWVEAYREPLVQRQELRPPLARRLYALVSAALRAHILEHFDIDPEALDDELEPLVVARAEPAVRTPGRPASKPDSDTLGTSGATRQTSPTLTGEVLADEALADEALADALGSVGAAADAAQSRLTAPQTLITLLRGGDRSGFQQQFAALSGLRSPRLEQVLYGGDGKELAVACRALGIEKKDFAVIVFLCRQAGPHGGLQVGLRGHLGVTVEDPRAVAQVIDYFDQMEPEAALVRLRRWRRDPDYVAAIEDLETQAEARAAAQEGRGNDV